MRLMLFGAVFAILMAVGMLMAQPGSRPLPETVTPPVLSSQDNVVMVLLALFPEEGTTAQQNKRVEEFLVGALDREVPAADRPQEMLKVMRDTVERVSSIGEGKLVTIRRIRNLK